MREKRVFKGDGRAAGDERALLTTTTDRPTDAVALRKQTQSITGREVCVYSISCKNQTNIDLTLQWLTKHAKT